MAKGTTSMSSVFSSIGTKCNKRPGSDATYRLLLLVLKALLSQLQQQLFVPQLCPEKPGVVQFLCETNCDTIDAKSLP